jgi:hypothetical protein
MMFYGIIENVEVLIDLLDAEWCNGSTNDSDSFCLGSNPSSAAKREFRPLSELLLVNFSTLTEFNVYN